MKTVEMLSADDIRLRTHRMPLELETRLEDALGYFNEPCTIMVELLTTPRLDEQLGFELKGMEGYKISRGVLIKNHEGADYEHFDCFALNIGYSIANA